MSFENNNDNNPNKNKNNLLNVFLHDREERKKIIEEETAWSKLNENDKINKLINFLLLYRDNKLRKKKLNKDLPYNKLISNKYDMDADYVVTESYQYNVGLKDNKNNYKENEINPVLLSSYHSKNEIIQIINSDLESGELKEKKGKEDEVDMDNSYSSSSFSQSNFSSSIPTQLEKQNKAEEKEKEVEEDNNLFIIPQESLSILLSTHKEILSNMEDDYYISISHLISLMKKREDDIDNISLLLNSSETSLNRISKTMEGFI
jgi:hypothetical protein